MDQFVEGVTGHTLRSQAAFQIAQNPYHYSRHILKLYGKHLDFHSYVMAVASGEFGWDPIMLGALSVVHQFRLSIISSKYKDIWHVFHNGRPNIVIIANGGDVLSSYPATHFSPTGK